MSNQATGPRSEEGKERSSQNATKHGLRSERPVITGEDPAEWDAFRNDIVQTYRPATILERELAERVALQMWRFRRVTRFETQVINDAMDAAGRHTAYTITGIYADPRAQTVKLAFEEEQKYREELALVPAAQKTLAEVHNLPPDTAIEPDVAWLLLNLFHEDEGSEPQPMTAGALRRGLTALARKPLAQTLRAAAERLEERRQDLEKDLAAASRRMEFLTLETARQGDALRHERVLPLDEALKRVQRYESHVSRQLDQAIKLLEKVQAERRAREEVQKSAVGSPQSAGGNGSATKTPAQAVREVIVEAIARRLQLPPGGEGEISFDSSDEEETPTPSGEGSFGNSGGEVEQVEPPAGGGSFDEFVRHLAAGRHNGAPSPNGSGAVS
jgi:hypothetical protein